VGNAAHRDSLWRPVTSKDVRARSARVAGSRSPATSGRTPFPAASFSESAARLKPREIEVLLDDLGLNALRSSADRRAKARSAAVLHYGEEEATWHGLERARQERLSRSGPYVDGQIAAFAHVSDLILVTANAKDFSRFKDLRVEDWTRSNRLDAAPTMKDAPTCEGTVPHRAETQCTVQRGQAM
jgi:predicted nucleic acid-binding protein